MIVLDNIVFGMELVGINVEECREKVFDVLCQVGLENYVYSYLDEFFGGMCQCVGLVCVLAINLDILLMDEVFSVFDLLICIEM